MSPQATPGVVGMCPRPKTGCPNLWTFTGTDHQNRSGVSTGPQPARQSENTRPSAVPRPRQTEDQHAEECTNHLDTSHDICLRTKHTDHSSCSKPFTRHFAHTVRRAPSETGIGSAGAPTTIGSVAGNQSRTGSKIGAIPSRTGESSGAVCTTTCALHDEAGSA